MQADQPRHGLRQEVSGSNGHGLRKSSMDESRNSSETWLASYPLSTGRTAQHRHHPQPHMLPGPSVRPLTHAMCRSHVGT